MVIRYAIVGTSWISEEFFLAACGGQVVSLCSEMVLCGVCSRTEEKGRAFACKIGRPDVEIFTSVEALAASPAIDAVYVASPNSCHAPQSEILLGAGKHVICEKPVAADPEQLEKLQALARRQGLVFMEAIMYLHTPARRERSPRRKRIGRTQCVRRDHLGAPGFFAAVLPLWPAQGGR